MADYYYNVDGMKSLAKLGQLRPELMQAFNNFCGKVLQDGALSAKIKGLVAIAVAHVTQCPYCIDTHVKRTKAAGATDEEIAEVIFVAMALRAGGSFAHASMAMDAAEK